VTVIKPEPISAKIRGIVSLATLLPRDAREQMRESLEHDRQPGEPVMSEQAIEFLSHYMLVSRAGWSLLQMPPFESLSRKHEQLEQEFMSGGPPMSPIYDSYSAIHTLAEVPVGIGSETPMTVLARLTANSIEHRSVHLLASQAASSHLDLYRAKDVNGVTAHIVHARSGAELAVHLTGPFLRRKDLFLGRVFQFHTGDYFIADSPYRLMASEAAWLGYFARVAPPDGDVKNRARAEPRKKHGGKERKNQTAPRSNSEALLLRHLRYGESPRFWPEFILNAYAGDRNGIVALAGIPDRPQTQPHHDDFDESTVEPDPAEIETALATALMTQLRRTLDEPIPMFRNKTLRQLARNPKSRPDAISWLREQERILRTNPQPIEVNLRPLWAELGLEYQGLEMEPTK
jgi:hypothetical protein